MRVVDGVEGDIRETARSFYAQPPIGKVLAEFFRLYKTLVKML